MIEIDPEKLEILSDVFRGLWQVKEPTMKTRKAIEIGRSHRESITQWCVTFKYDGDFMETEPQDTPNEALDYAIKFLEL